MKKMRFQVILQGVFSLFRDKTGRASCQKFENFVHPKEVFGSRSFKVTQGAMKILKGQTPLRVAPLTTKIEAAITVVWH
jgi:hypothetical protein